MLHTYENASDCRRTPVLAASVPAQGDARHQRYQSLIFQPQLIGVLYHLISNIRYTIKYNTWRYVWQLLLKERHSNCGRDAQCGSLPWLATHSAVADLALATGNSGQLEWLHLQDWRLLGFLQPAQLGIAACLLCQSLDPRHDRRFAARLHNRKTC